MYCILCCRHLQGNLVKRCDLSLRIDHGVKHDGLTAGVWSTVQVFSCSCHASTPAIANECRYGGRPVKRMEKTSLISFSPSMVYHVKPLLWRGFIFRFIERHALLQQPWSAYMRNLKGCVHVSFLHWLPGKNRRMLFPHSYIMNWIFVLPCVALSAVYLHFMERIPCHMWLACTYYENEG